MILPGDLVLIKAISIGGVVYIIGNIRSVGDAKIKLYITHRTIGKILFDEASHKRDAMFDRSLNSRLCDSTKE